MTLICERDDKNRRILITVTGVLQVADILGVVDSQAHDGTWDYACLYDRRGMSAGPTTADVVPIARYIRELETIHGQRGPVAVVGDRTGSAETYARLSKQIGLPFEIFDDIGAAEAWLTGHGYRAASTDSGESRRGGDQN